MLCSKLPCIKAFEFKPFFYKIVNPPCIRGAAPLPQTGYECTRAASVGVPLGIRLR